MYEHFSPKNTSVDQCFLSQLKPPWCHCAAEHWCVHCVVYFDQLLGPAHPIKLFKIFIFSKKTVTRLVYNLFQDLWNWFMVQKCVQKWLKTNIAWALKGAALSAPPNLFPNLWKQDRWNLAWFLCCLNFFPRFLRSKSKHMCFLINFPQNFLLFSHFFSIFFAENEDFDQLLGYTAPKSWSKYTTLVARSYWTDQNRESLVWLGIM